MTQDWRTDLEIVWHNTPPAGADEIVRRDILNALMGLKVPSDLVTHTVFLGEDMDGPSVSVWGREHDHRFHAEYSTETEWLTLNEVSDD